MNARTGKAYVANCDADPSVGAIPTVPGGLVYPCDLSHFSHDDGWYCVTFNAKNEVVNFERSYVNGICG